MYLDTFNNNKDGIEFTLERASNNGLPFLDTRISIHNNIINYGWYMKDLHSGNCMKADAYMANNVKHNFVRNRFDNIFASSNNNIELNNGVIKMCGVLKNNGYKPNQIKFGLRTAVKRFNDKNRIHRDKNAFSDTLKTHTLMKVPNLGKDFNLQVEKRATELGFNLKVINGRSSRISDLAKPDKFKASCNKDHCIVCRKLESRFNCETDNVIYKFTCTKCGAAYIGKTDNTMNIRFYQHRMAINRGDVKNPLVRHHIETHTDSTHDINDWHLTILKKCSGDPVDTALTESYFIENEQPAINKKRRECRTLFESK